MVTKYDTGQAVMIPAVIRAAREVNGVIFYDVDTWSWDGVREEDIEISEKAVSAMAMRELERKLREVY